VVLGLIVAKVSGKPNGDFLRERILAPLKMADSVVFQKGKNTVPNRAYGHSKNGDTFKETDQSSTSATLGDGGVYSSVDDLSKWDDALGNHSLLSEEEMKPALEPAQFGGDGKAALPEDAPAALHGVSVKYGFGWFLDPYKGHERMWHYGDTMGFKTAIQRFTKDRLTVIVLCNRTDLDPGALATKVAELYLSKMYLRRSGKTGEFCEVLHFGPCRHSAVLFHHLGHLHVLLQDHVDGLYGGAAPLCYSFAAL